MKRFLLLFFVSLFFGTSYAQSDENADKFKRVLLLEEFTGEACPNCPIVARWIERFYAKPEFAETMIPVSHHSGHWNDWLTTEEDTKYLWLFNDHATFAPAVMFDRVSLFKSMSRKPTPVGFIGVDSIMEDSIRSRMSIEAHVALSIKAELENDTTVRVYVDGERDDLLGDDIKHINVFIVQDSIKAKGQKGGGSNYYHRHVFRKAYQTWGEPIEWKGNDFNYECSITVDPSWDKNGLKIVAFVASFNKRNPNANSVDNTRQIPFPVGANILDVNEDKTVVKTEYFTMDGIKTLLNSKGLYIVKYTFSDGSTGVKKINL